MRFAQFVGVLDTVGGVVELARRFRRGGDQPEAGAAGGAPLGPALGQATGGGPLGVIEARLAGVVVAALKEAFDRDSARMELERSHIDAERGRAEQALRAELRRQSADRMLGQLRLVAVMAISTWALSAVLGVYLPGMSAALPRVLLGAGWLMALGALGGAFVAWQQISAWSSDVKATSELGAASFAPWLLLAALALTGASLLVAL